MSKELPDFQTNLEHDIHGQKQNLFSRDANISAKYV